MFEEESIKAAATQLEIILKENDFAGNKQLLAGKINELILHNFQKLVLVLYRMDVSEIKLKQLLKDNPAEDAAKIITELMIERQAEKIKSRRQFSQRDNDIDENEKW